MKQNERISYEKPALSQYGLFGIVDGKIGLSQGGNIDEDCDANFDS